MNRGFDPAAYEAWYHASRGRWIAEREFNLLWELLSPKPETTLLDVGCGTGHFSRRFAAKGLAVTGLDPDRASLMYAAGLGGGIHYLEGDTRALPFPDESFDCVAAVTSLCFVPDPITALQEMWRVTRSSLVLGLLNRRSLLYLSKHSSGGYRGARWDSASEIQNDWLQRLAPLPDVKMRSAIYLPGGGLIGRQFEQWISPRFLFGGFLALHLKKPE
jgi:SAM-dependent methyltransferase